MDEAERIMQGLARIAVAHPGCDAVVSEAIALIEGRGDELDRLCVSFAKLAAKSSQQQAEIERLTPKSKPRVRLHWRTGEVRQVLDNDEVKDAAND